MKMICNVVTRALAGGCLALFAARAGAVEDQLAEVVVTAEKVTASIRDVPVSVTVLSGVELQELHISNLEDLTRAAPNVSFNSNGNPGGSTLGMRGISATAGASTIGMYLDDVPITARMLPASITQAAQPEPQLIDVDQVEVLRGPQGSLYGASAEGGLIKFRSNVVNLSSFSGSGLSEVSSTEHGSGLNYKISGVLNAPIIDGTAGFRLAAQTIHDTGFIDRFAPDTGAKVADDVNGDRKDAARLAVRVAPLEGLTVDASLFYQHITYGSSNTVTLGLGGFATNSQVPDNGSDTLAIPSLTVQYDMNWGSLVSVTSNYQRSVPFTYDGTAFNSGYLGCILDGFCGSAPVSNLNGNLSGSQIAALPSPGMDTEHDRQFTEEIRVASKPYQEGDSRFTWVAGLFYLDSHDHRTDNEPILGFNSVFENLYGAALLNSIFGGPLPGDSTFSSTLHYAEKQYAVFGDLTYHITSQLRVSVGSRYLSAHQEEGATLTGWFNGGTSSYDVKSTASPVTPRASVAYQFNDSVSSYATASKGFRLGGPNAPVPTEFCGADLAARGYKAAPGSYEPDSLWNYEIGVKARPSNRVEMSASVFYDRWSQLQQQFVLPTCGFSFTTNVGRARSYGSEIEVHAIPVRGLTLGLALGYTHATLTDGSAQLGVVPGQPLEDSPNWSGNASAQYNVPLSGALTGYIRANYNYVGASHGALVVTDADYSRPTYGLAGASLGVQFHAFDVSAYVTNLLGEDKVIQTPNHATVPVGVVLRPRTYGVNITGRF